MIDVLDRITPVQTPCLVVVEAALDANLAAMQHACDQAGVGLRAHAKMHKASEIARLQTAGGAVGVCAQTLGEAEVLKAAGISDVLVTAPPSPHELSRICALAGLGGIAVVLDDLALALPLSERAAADGLLVPVLIDVDLGQRRTGLDPKDAPALARRLLELPGLTLRGVQAYLGHLQHIVSWEVRREANLAAVRRLKALVCDLRGLGLGAPVVTGGGTGTYAADLAGGAFTEIQAGSYAFMDVEYGACEAPGGGEWPFQPALFLAARVISARHPSHVVIDAGIKSLSTDGPLARIVRGAPQGSVYRIMGDEHGAIFHPSALTGLSGARDPLSFSAAIGRMDEALAWPADAPKLGDLIWLQPGHCDPTVNLHEAYYFAGADGGLRRVPIDARRRAPSV